MKLGKRPLQKPRKIWNINNTANQAGAITHYITLNIQTNGIQKQIQFLVTNIGNEDIILGYPWMAAFEPQFSRDGRVINEKALPIILWSVNPSIPGKDPIIARIKGSGDDCHLQATTATELAIKAQQYMQKVEVLREYQQFAKLFSEEESKRYPSKQAWDHAIKFKKDAPEAVDCKVYPMNRIKDDAVQKFLNSELEKGYIRESKSPYASSFFFIKKKDSKLRPVQDYRKINALIVMIRTLRVMGLVPPQYVITSYRFCQFPLFPLPCYYPIPVLSIITHCLTCFNCVWLCSALWYQLCDHLSI